MSVISRQSVAVLATTGRRTGVIRKTPVTVTPYEDGFLIGGGAGGQKATPDWVFNLRATPTASLIFRRGDVRSVTVEEPTGEARQRAYAHMRATYPDVEKFETWGQRPLPLFILRPR